MQVSENFKFFKSAHKQESYHSKHDGPGDSYIQSDDVITKTGDANGNYTQRIMGR